MLTLVPTPEPDPAPLAPGDALGPYVLEALIGEGTMGRVYRAKHARLGRPVALKVLHARHLSDDVLVARFLQEAKLVNQISHPHIVEVHDFVDEASPRRVYGVMELLHGQTLAERLQQGPLPLADACLVARQVADALHAAHRVGVVHRDLKPDNVYLARRDGSELHVKVLDFGVAKLLQPARDLRVAETQQGVMVGTPRYMAPEQAAGLEVDARTDVYALGTMLYEVLTGRPPFEATVFGQLASDIITRPPPPLPRRTHAGEPIPQRLVELVAACLAKTPDQRPPSMAAVAAWLDGTSAPAPGKRWVFAVAAAAAVLAGAGAWTLRPREAVAERAAAAVTPPPPVALAPAPPAPEEKAAEPPVNQEITVTLVTTPPRAAVVRADTGQPLGVTPLELHLPREKRRVKLRFELPGYQRLEREVSLQADQSLELSLPAAARKTAPRPVTDGVLDPY